MQQMPGRDAYLDGLLALCNGSGRPRKSFCHQEARRPGHGATDPFAACARDFDSGPTFVAYTIV